MGRAVAELVEHAEYKTVNLARFRMERFEEGEMVFEEGIV